MSSLLTQIGEKIWDIISGDKYIDVGDANHTASASDSGKAINIDPSTQDRNFTINNSATAKGWKTQVKNLDGTNDVIFSGSATLRTPGNPSPTTIKIVGSSDQYGTAYLEAIDDDEIVIRGDITVT